MTELQSNPVFISYSRKDNDAMRRVANYLRAQGLTVWVDNEKLIPGTPVWEEEIEKAISSASAIVVILSPDAKNSQWVRREITLADQNHKRIFPVLVRGDEGSAISIRLTGRQYVDLRQNKEAGLKSLVETLSSYLGKEAAGLQGAHDNLGKVTAPQKRAGASSTAVAIVVIVSLLVGAILFLPGLLQPQQPDRDDPTDVPITEALSEPPVESSSEELSPPSPFNDVSTQLAFGPQRGALNLEQSENFWATDAASVALQDFIVTATFQNPFSASRGYWTHAIFFRDQYGTEQYRLIIAMDQTWALSDSGNVNAIIQMGDVPNLRLSPDDSNTIWLLCQGDQGTFYLNGEYVANLDLSTRQNSGDVQVARFFSGDEGDGYSTSFQDFAVWEIR